MNHWSGLFFYVISINFIYDLLHSLVAKGLYPLGDALSDHVYITQRYFFPSLLRIREAFLSSCLLSFFKMLYQIFLPDGPSMVEYHATGQMLNLAVSSRWPVVPESTKIYYYCWLKCHLQSILNILQKTVASFGSCTPPHISSLFKIFFFNPNYVAILQ